MADQGSRQPSGQQLNPGPGQSSGQGQPSAPGPGRTAAQPGPWAFGMSIGTRRITAATWSPAAVEELRLDGAVTTPAALTSARIPDPAAERAFAEVLDWFVTVGRARFGEQLPSAVTIVMAWEATAGAYAAVDRVLAVMFPQTPRRVIAAPPGAPGSPGTGEDQEPARVVAGLGGVTVAAMLAGPAVPPGSAGPPPGSATAQPLVAVPPVSGAPRGPAGVGTGPAGGAGSRGSRRSVPLPVLIGVVAALVVVALLAYLPLQQRYSTERAARAQAQSQLDAANRQLKDVAYDLPGAGAATLNGKYKLSLANTACVAFGKESCGTATMDLTIATCSGAPCVTGDSSVQKFSQVKAKSTAGGLQVTGAVTGYTCDGDPIKDATWTMNLWPVATSYDAKTAAWNVTGIGASLILETHGAKCDIGLLAWSGSTPSS